MLQPSRRKNAEYSLAQAFYNTAGARSAFYPALSLSGTLGWTNDGGVTTLDPAKWIFNAAASLVQPIFNAGRNQAQLRIAKAQQQEALLSFQQTLLNAGAEVNNASPNASRHVPKSICARNRSLRSKPPSRAPSS